jgi:hypothetical protein
MYYYSLQIKMGFKTKKNTKSRNFITFSLSEYRVRWVPVTTAWRVLGLRMEERPPAMEVSCEYIEQAAVDKRQGVDIQLGGWA